jgi:hemolysin III
LAGLVLACAGTFGLVARAAWGSASMVTSAVYGACLVGVYAASSAYHLLPCGRPLRLTLRALDHAAIFLMIAGTCTPIFWRAFDGSTRTTMLSWAWGLAAAGVAFRLLWPSAPRPLSTVMYVLLGWMFLVPGPSGFRALPALVSVLLLAGGITYTLGAIVYAIKRPNPVPRVFGFHEIWHLFVLGGSALHYAAIAVLA